MLRMTAGRNWRLWLIVIICSLSNLLVLGHFDVDVYGALAQSNFITTVPNVIMLLVVYRYLYLNHRMKLFLIPRIGLQQYLKQQLKNSCLLMAIYLMIQYGVNASLLQVAYPDRISVIGLYMLINFVILIGQVLILNLINFDMNGYAIVTIVLIINFIMHYGIVQNSLSSLYVRGHL